MSEKLMGWDDTIVALATPPGIGAIGVIRVSGKQTFSIINQLFPSKNLSAQASHTVHVGLLKFQNELLDEVVLALFKGPKSYTGEDTIEISCHGSQFIIEKIIATAFNIEEFEELINFHKVSYRSYIAICILPINLFLFYNTYILISQLVIY